MSESKKFVAEWLLIICAGIAVIMLLSSCTANRHLKRSQHHYEQAIAKGYEPLNDTVKTVNSIKPVAVTISTPNRTIIVNRIDSILKVNDCLDSLIRSQILEVIDTVIYYYELDTTITAPNGAKVRLQFKDGAINPEWENIDVQPIIYVEKLPYWARWVIGISILFLILILFRILFRILSKIFL
jgi:hypothetical protein